MTLWCHTHQHTHVANIPLVTYECHHCGFGSWDTSVAKTHAINWPEHEVFFSYHKVVVIPDASS